MEVLYICTIFQTIFSGYILLHSSYIALIHGRYLQFRYPLVNKHGNLKIPYKWRFLARKILHFYGPFSSHVWLPEGKSHWIPLNHHFPMVFPWSDILNKRKLIISSVARRRLAAAAAEKRLLGEVPGRSARMVSCREIWHWRFCWVNMRYWRDTGEIYRK